MVRKSKSWKKFLVILVLMLIAGTAFTVMTVTHEKTAKRVYWLIPDGLRNDDYFLDMYYLADKGYLPNIKRMMDEGSYGYAIPVFPSHTPVNYAALLTGSYPSTNGIADGPMRAVGKPLDKVAVAGFRSVARRIPAIWSTLEEHGKKTFVVSVPGSTPPEVKDGVVIRGRWGGWGADLNSIVFESRGNNLQRVMQGRSTKLFFFGSELTRYVDLMTLGDVQSFNTSISYNLSMYGKEIYSYAIDTVDDGIRAYDSVIFTDNDNNILTVLKEGEWSRWINMTFKWNGEDIKSSVKFNLILLDDDGFLRVRVLVDSLNEYMVFPQDFYTSLQSLGPLVDFVDNYPPQLIYYPEDKQVFEDEMNESFDWHTRLIPKIINEYSPDFVIHGIYNPNQMLTSRWWLGYIDPKSLISRNISLDEKRKLFGEVLNMYKRVDKMVGEILDNSDENTIIVLSSDHGAVPLNRWVRLNNLLMKEGLLKARIDNTTGEPVIDWKNSKAIFLKMDNIFINSRGLAGNFTRDNSSEYYILRERIANLLKQMNDTDGTNPLAGIVFYEDANVTLHLPDDRIGDIVVVNKAGYGWNEEITENMELFSVPLETGYKQAVNPANESGMWTPFIIMGPGVKKNHRIEKPISLIDEYPTIMRLYGMEIPSFVDGKPVDEIFVK